MMDYRQLALKYVLGSMDDERVEASAMTAQKLEAAPLEIKDWILSVSRWLSPADGDDDDRDMIMYGKAVEYLSATLDRLEKSRRIFKQAQIGLLVTFFCNIVQNHHGGVLPSCRALQSLISMPAFPPDKATEIISALEQLGDNFRLQTSSTRIVAYQLLSSLVTSDGIGKELDAQPGARGVFFKSILDVCKNERDPACLMVWFGVLKEYLNRHSPSKDMVERTFTVFSSYFPITVRASQAPAGITGEDLKNALRNCFSAHDDVAQFAIPYLTSKLERGEGLTLSVRIDILKTLETSLVRYRDVAATISPHTDKLWSVLKHEVRSSDEPEAIQMALQTMRTLTRRLDKADLSRFLSAVSTDCYEDLTSPSLAEAAGKLLLVVLSATDQTFVELVPKTIDFLKRQLAGSSNALHLKDLVVVLNSILELRPAIESNESSHLQASVFEQLFDETYDPLVQRHLRVDADSDDLTVVCKVLRGLGLLASQLTGKAAGDAQKRLLSDETLQTICARLSGVVLESLHQPQFALVVQEAANALAQISSVYDQALRIFDAVVISPELHLSCSSNLQRTIPIFVFIGTRELPVVGDQLDRFVFLVASLLRMLQPDADGQRAPTRVTAEVLLGILNAMVQFRSRFISSTCEAIIPADPDSDPILSRYTDLAELRSDDGPAKGASDQLGSDQTLEEAFFAVCYWATRRLVCQATVLLRTEDDLATPYVAPGSAAIHDDSQTTNVALEELKLVTLGRIAKFTTRHISVDCQIRLGLPAQIFCLFQPVRLELSGSAATTNEAWPLAQSAWNLIRYSASQGTPDVSQISLGIAEGIAPGAMKTLTNVFPIHLSLLKDLGDHPDTASALTPSMQALLATIANRFLVQGNHEVLEAILSIIEDAVGTGLSNVAADAERVALARIAAVVAGALMRHSKGGQLNPMCEALMAIPATPRLGHLLGRELEQVVAPIIDDECGLSIVLPTWKAKTYHQLVRPMLERALPRPDLSNDELLICSNYRISVLGMLRWIDFTIYEDDADRVLRAAICLIQDVPSGREASSALLAIRSITDKSPETAKSHLPTLVRLSIRILQLQPHDRPGWMPIDYLKSDISLRGKQMHQSLALDVLMFIAQRFGEDELQIQELAIPVNRALVMASGLGARSLREKVRLARNLWRTIKA